MTKLFSTQLESFVCQFYLREDQANIFKHEVIKWLMRIQEGQGASKIKSFAHTHGFETDWMYFKSQYLDVSQYVQVNLWKSVISTIKENTSPQIEHLRQDVSYVLSFLEAEEIEKIKNLEVDFKLDMKPIDILNFKTGKVKKKDIFAYARSKIGGLSYLTKYDGGIDMEDFEQDMLLEMVKLNNISFVKSQRTNLSDEDLTDGKKEELFQPYAEKSMNNKVLNIKEYWSCDSRRRVNTTDVKDYKKRNKLKKALSKEPNNEELKSQLEKIERKIKRNNSDYYATNVPLMRGQDGDERECDAQELNRGTHESFIVNDTENFEEMYSFIELLESLPEKIALWASIVAELPNPKFDEWFDNWAKRRHEEEGKKLYSLDNYQDRKSGALEYCGLTMKDIKNHSKLLSSLSRSNGKSCFEHLYKKGKRKGDILVAKIGTSKPIKAKLEDMRDDGSMIFTVYDPQFRGTYDTGYDQAWKILQA